MFINRMTADFLFEQFDHNILCSFCHNLQYQMINRYALLYTLLITTLQIDTKCNSDFTNIKQSDSIDFAGVCPANSHCLPNGQCDCDVGYVAGCTQKAVRLENRVENSVQISSWSYSFLQVVASRETYTLLSFNVCRLNSTEISSFLIDVWDDNGTLKQLTKENAQFGGKIWPLLPNNCLILTTPFMLFSRKTNGETEGFILGLKRLQEGSQTLLISVAIQEIDFWSLMSKLLFVIGFCFFVTLTIAVLFIIYKRRRRQLFMQNNNREKDIKHLDIFMPKIKVTKGENSHLAMELCSICLIELGEDNQLRRTVCGHVFHIDCIDSWCKSNLSCPVCRKSFDFAELKDTVQSVDMTAVSNVERLRQNIL